MSGKAIRWMLFSAGLLTIALGTLPFATAETISDAGLLRVGGFALMGCGLAMVTGFFPTGIRWGHRFSFWFLMGVAVLPRILLLPAPESDDIHRYRWEGRLVLAGENPYRAAADDPSLKDYRDEDWGKMNHRERGTVYPPVAQLFFAGMASVEELIPPLWLEKGLFLACDLGIFALVLLLLRRRRLPPSYSLFYALNPVVLVSFAAEAHYDSLFVLPLVGAVLALETGRARLSWLLLALSIQVKLVSVILVPLWLVRRVWRGLLSAGLLIALTWLPFVVAVPAWLSAVFAFGGTSAFFGLIPFIFRSLGLPLAAAAPTGTAVFCGALIWILLRGGSPATQARRSIAALIVCSPILHFWYLAWLAPFLALRPSLAWLWLCGAQAFYFFVWHNQTTEGIWRLPGWVEPVVWLPFLLLGIGEGWRTLQNRRAAETGQGSGTVGVVIPTLNAGDVLEKCLLSIEDGSSLPDQCLVVDGGSHDQTVDLARSRGVEIAEATTGRGSQIEAGIRQLNTEWVLILHADCMIHPEAIETIRSLDRECAGGACGQRFTPGGPLLTVVEFMNEGRAVQGESYWGDQGQFFRRNQEGVWSGLSAYPLMEDVELSRRLRRSGETRYLGLETETGTARWVPGRRRDRLLLVFRAVITFRLAALCGRSREASRRLYQEYYGSS